MSVQSVRAPDGRTWQVAVRRFKRPRWRGPDPDDWLPFRRGDRGGGGVGDGGADGGGDWGDWGDLGAVVALAVVAIAVVLLLTFFLLPLLIFVVEFLLVLAAAYVIRRAWVVEAVTADPPTEARQWHVRGGRRRAQRAADEVALELSRGDPDSAPEDAER